MQADSPAIAAHKPAARSKITNGSAILDGADMRGRTARRFRDVLGEIVSDLGGDPAQLSEGQRQLARRCAMLAVECEKIEAHGVAGEAIDLDSYGQLTDRIGRAFQRLGLKRQARDVTPRLSEYLASIARPPQAAPTANEAEDVPA